MHHRVHLLVILLLSSSRPAPSEASVALAGVCREHGLKSRYCRPFTLPACSFARIDRLLRRQEGRRQSGTRVTSRRLRRSAWIPTVSAEWGRTDLLDVSSSWRPGETVSANEDLGQRSFWKVRATWDLRGLAFDPRELALGREERARRVFLQERLDRTRRLYYQWLHEVLELRRDPGPRRLLACEELEAALDALTSGAFSGMLPSGP